MKENIVYTDPYGSGMYITLLEFREWHPESTPDGYDDERGYSVPIQEWIIKTKSGAWVKCCSYHANEVGREKTFVREIRKRAAINWLHFFSAGAKLQKKPMRCDAILPDNPGRSVCPYLRIMDDHTARCGVNWNSWGYSSGGEGRPLPADHTCDVASENAAKLMDMPHEFDKSFFDAWRIYRGVARKLIEAPEQAHA